MKNIIYIFLLVKKEGHIINYFVRINFDRYSNILFFGLRVNIFYKI